MNPMDPLDTQERETKRARFKEDWVAQLRAAATQVADQAEAIVGDLEGNVELKVSIILKTDTEEIHWPRLTIEREIVPTGAVREKIRELKEIAAARRTEENRRELGLDEIRER